MAEIVKLLGPPGTGKTTTLLEYVEEELKTVPIENGIDNAADRKRNRKRSR